MGESLTLLEEVREECADYDKVPGLGCYLSLEAWLLHLDAEFLTATKSFKPGVFDEEEEFKPCTWNVELALQPIERLQIAGKLEYGRELAPDMIERRLGGAASFGITEYLTVAAEYLHTRFENDKPDEDAVRMQLAAKF